MELNDAIRGRRTVRRFQQKPVEKDKLHAMIEAARLASSGSNQQPLRYQVIQDAGLVTQLLSVTHWAGQVQPRRNPELGKTAPLVFIVVTKHSNANPQVEAGAAIQNMQLTAYAQGLGCCWIGAYDHKEADRILGLDARCESIYLVAVGYPGEAPVLENVGPDASIKYYLDDNDVLHVPKYTVEAITEWR